MKFECRNQSLKQRMVDSWDQNVKVILPLLFQASNSVPHAVERKMAISSRASGNGETMWLAVTRARHHHVHVYITMLT